MLQKEKKNIASYYTVDQKHHYIHPPAANAKMNTCFSVYQNSEVAKHKKKILTHLFLQQLWYLWLQIPCELFRGEQQRTLDFE